MSDVELFVVHSNTLWANKFVPERNTWNHLLVYKRMISGSFENASTKLVHKLFNMLK